MRKTKGVFKQLTYSDRVKIETLLNAGHKVSYIAQVVHKSTNTIYNEIKRGMYDHLNYDYTVSVKYSAIIAQDRKEKLQSGKGVNLKIGSDYEFAEFVEDMILNKKYSPEATLLYIKQHNLNFKTNICKTTLYNYIDKGLFLNLTNKDLCVKGRRRKNYNTVKRIKRAAAGESIEYRDKNILKRHSFAHWEMDTVKGSRGKSKSCLLVLTERLTRQEIIVKLPDQKSSSVVSALDELRKKYKSDFPKIFKTITCDNGVEFSDYENMKKDTKIYYCHPYSSWERGSNENNNKLIRRHIPKGADIDKYSDAQIEVIQNWINNYPRKLLGGMSSQELFTLELSKLGISVV